MKKPYLAPVMLLSVIFGLQCATEEMRQVRGRPPGTGMRREPPPRQDDHGSR